MKRALSVVLALLTVFGLCGCSEKEPVPDPIYSDTAISGMKQAIKIIDDYLAFEISADEAAEKLERIERVLGRSDELMDNIVGSSISNARNWISLSDLSISGSEEFDNVRQSRDDIYNNLYGLDGK